MDNWMYEPSQATGTTSPLGSTANPTSSTQRDRSSPEAKHGGNATAARIRRRNRLINSCLECRRRKLKCDKQAPCTNCTRFKRDCLYLASSTDPSSQQKLADIKEKMGALERNLEREVAGQGAKSSPKPGRATGSPMYAIQNLEEDEDDAVGPEDEEDLEPSGFITLDNVYASDADDDFVDLGVQLGRMRITERVGGWVRPNLTNELTTTLKANHEGSIDGAFPSVANNNNVQSGEPTKIQASSKSYIGPGTDYIAPASSFLFPGTNLNTSLIDYLPSKKAADQLIAQYFVAVHYLCTTVHRQTFESAYSAFWVQIMQGVEPPPSRQAVIFAAMFSAAVSLSEEQVMQQFGTSKASLIDSLRSGSEYALCKANLLRTTKFETMQAFVMYLIPQIRGEVSRAHSALVGTAIRLAECMGLHRDGLYYNMTPIETQVRRLVWQQLLFLDMRTCDATGPRPQIRFDDYDTQYPWNVDEIDLVNAQSPPQDKNHWTNGSFARIRAEVSDIRRHIHSDLQQLDKKKKSLTSILIRVQRTLSDFSERFLPWIDESVPFQYLAKTFLTTFFNGMFVAALHRYMPNAQSRMPDRLRQIAIEAATSSLESAIELDANVKLAPWAWYRGAFNQYHVALLLLVELHRFPMRRQAARVWKCLDYVFDIPPHLTPHQKGELVLTDLRDRMGVYHEMRKLRSTAQVESMGKPSPSSQVAIPREARVKEATSLDAAVQLDYPIKNETLAFTPATNFSPPPAATESSGSHSRQNSVGLSNDVQMMADIDWAEWDKYFPLESNTGDLNIPDFDLSQYTGDYTTAPIDPSAFAMPPTTAASIPNDLDLADVHFTPTYYPAPSFPSANSAAQPQNGGAQGNTAPGTSETKPNIYGGSWTGV